MGHWGGVGGFILGSMGIKMRGFKQQKSQEEMMQQDSDQISTRVLQSPVNILKQEESLKRFMHNDTKDNTFEIKIKFNENKNGEANPNQRDAKMKNKKGLQEKSSRMNTSKQQQQQNLQNEGFEKVVFANLNLNNETPKSRQSELEKDDYKATDVDMPKNLGTLTIDKEDKVGENGFDSSQTLVNKDVVASGLKAYPSQADSHWEAAPAKQQTANNPVTVQIQLLQAVGEDSKREDSNRQNTVGEPMKSLLTGTNEHQSNKSCGTTSNFQESASVRDNNTQRSGLLSKMQRKTNLGLQLNSQNSNKDLYVLGGVDQENNHLKLNPVGGEQQSHKRNASYNEQQSGMIKGSYAYDQQKGHAHHRRGPGSLYPSHWFRKEAPPSLMNYDYSNEQNLNAYRKKTKPPAKVTIGNLSRLPYQTTQTNMKESAKREEISSDMREMVSVNRGLKARPGIKNHREQSRSRNAAEQQQQKLMLTGNPFTDDHPSPTIIPIQYAASPSMSLQDTFQTNAGGSFYQQQMTLHGVSSTLSRIQPKISKLPSHTRDLKHQTKKEFYEQEKPKRLIQIGELMNGNHENDPLNIKKNQQLLRQIDLDSKESLKKNKGKDHFVPHKKVIGKMNLLSKDDSQKTQFLQTAEASVTFLLQNDLTQDDIKIDRQGKMLLTRSRSGSPHSGSEENRRQAAYIRNLLIDDPTKTLENSPGLKPSLKPSPSPHKIQIQNTQAEEQKSPFKSIKKTKTVEEIEEEHIKQLVSEMIRAQKQQISGNLQSQGSLLSKKVRRSGAHSVSNTYEVANKIIAASQRRQSAFGSQLTQIMDNKVAKTNDFSEPRLNIFNSLKSNKQSIVHGLQVVDPRKSFQIRQKSIEQNMVDKKSSDQLKDNPSKYIVSVAPVDQKRKKQLVALQKINESMKQGENHLRSLNLKMINQEASSVRHQSAGVISYIPQEKTPRNNNDNNREARKDEKKIFSQENNVQQKEDVSENYVQQGKQFHQMRGAYPLLNRNKLHGKYQSGKSGSVIINQDIEELDFRLEHSRQSGLSNAKINKIAPRDLIQNETVTSVLQNLVTKKTRSSGRFSQKEIRGGGTNQHQRKNSNHNNLCDSQESGRLLMKNAAAQNSSHHMRQSSIQQSSPKRETSLNQSSHQRLHEMRNVQSQPTEGLHLSGKGQVVNRIYTQTLEKQMSKQIENQVHSQSKHNDESQMKQKIELQLPLLQQIMPDPTSYQLHQQPIGQSVNPMNGDIQGSPTRLDLEKEWLKSGAQEDENLNKTNRTLLHANIQSQSQVLATTHSSHQPNQFKPIETQQSQIFNQTGISFPAEGEEDVVTEIEKAISLHKESQGLNLKNSHENLQEVVRGIRIENEWNKTIQRGLQGKKDELTGVLHPKIRPRVKGFDNNFQHSQQSQHSLGAAAAKKETQSNNDTILQDKEQSNLQKSTSDLAAENTSKNPQNLNRDTPVDRPPIPTLLQQLRVPKKLVDKAESNKTWTTLNMSNIEVDEQQVFTLQTLQNKASSLKFEEHGSSRQKYNNSQLSSNASQKEKVHNSLHHHEGIKRMKDYAQMSDEQIQAILQKRFQQAKKSHMEQYSMAQNMNQSNGGGSSSQYEQPMLPSKLSNVTSTRKETGQRPLLRPLPMSIINSSQNSSILRQLDSKQNTMQGTFFDATPWSNGGTETFGAVQTPGPAAPETDYQLAKIAENKPMMSQSVTSSDTESQQKNDSKMHTPRTMHNRDINLVNYNRKKELKPVQVQLEFPNHHQQKPVNNLSALPFGASKMKSKSKMSSRKPRNQHPFTVEEASNDFVDKNIRGVFKGINGSNYQQQSTSSKNTSRRIFESFNSRSREHDALVALQSHKKSKSNMYGKLMKNMGESSKQKSVKPTLKLYTMRDDNSLESHQSSVSEKSFSKEMMKIGAQAKQNTDLLREIVGEKAAKTLKMPDGTQASESPSKQIFGQMVHASRGDWQVVRVRDFNGNGSSQGVVVTAPLGHISDHKQLTSVLHDQPSQEQLKSARKLGGLSLTKGNEKRESNVSPKIKRDELLLQKESSSKNSKVVVGLVEDGNNLNTIEEEFAKIEENLHKSVEQLDITKTPENN